MSAIIGKIGKSNHVQQRHLEQIISLSSRSSNKEPGTTIKENFSAGFLPNNSSIVINNYFCFLDGTIYNLPDNTTPINYILEQLENVPLPEILNNINGDFAIALYDFTKNSLSLARDTAGIKPLYYKISKDNVYFSSEIKCLLLLENQDPIVDDKSILDLLSFGRTLDNRTVYKDIFSVPQGTMIELTPNGKMNKTSFWDLNINEKSSGNDKLYAEKLHSLLTNAIKIRTPKDVKTGIYLSGGLDSSVVAELCKNENPNLLALTGSFPNTKFDESIYAKITSEHSNIENKVIEITPEQDFFPNMKNGIWILDEPIVSPGVFSYMILAKQSSNYANVILGGQGSNEIFGGYPKYETGLSIINAIKTIKSLKPFGIIQAIKSAFKLAGKRGTFSIPKKLFMPEALITYHIFCHSHFGKPNFSHCFSSNFLQKISNYSPYTKYFDFWSNQKDMSSLNKMIVFDFFTKLPEIVRVEERLSMAFDIEIRNPFLDKRIIDFAMELPINQKISADESRIVLRNMAKGIVDDRILSKPKSGFEPPVSTWISQHFKNDIYNTIMNSPFIFNYLDKTSVKQLFDNHYSRGGHEWRIWQLLILELWYKDFISSNGRLAKERMQIYNE